MFTVDVELEYIGANPWQPRQGDPHTGAGDLEHIKNLALSIAADGLMQVPVGRLVDANGDPCGINEALKEAGITASAQEAWEYVFRELGCRVELAFGHSRLAAFRWLADVKDNSNLQGDWSRMPVALRDIRDEEMFRLGISENLKRKDLNAMEEAAAMLRFRDEFGKTSAEIGELFGLAESSVRNKLRLLGLPEDVRAALRDGRISEGAARELLSLYELPDELQQKGERFAYNHDGDMGRRSIAELALGGMPADQVREMITKLVKQNGRELSGAKWKWDRVYDKSLDARLVSETCQACPMRIQRDKNWYCVEFDCWRAREEINVRELLARASAATGIRPAEDLSRGWHDYMRLEEHQAAEIRASGCDHLRLVSSESAYVMQRKGMMVEGHPGVSVMCDRRNGQCTCANGIAARAKLAAAGIRVEQPVHGKPAEMHVAHAEAAEVQTPASNSGLKQAQIGNANELKELASQARRAAKQMRDEVQAMQEDFAHLVVNAFESRNARVMAELLLRFVYSTERYKFAQASPEEILYKAALHLAESKYDLNYYTTPDLGVAMSRFNEFLKEAGLGTMAVAQPAEPVYVAVEGSSKPLGNPRGGLSAISGQPEGKTLIDVFGDEERTLLMCSACGHTWRAIVEPTYCPQCGQGLVEDGVHSLPGQKAGETLMDYFARTEA